MDKGVHGSFYYTIIILQATDIYDQEETKMFTSFQQKRDLLHLFELADESPVSDILCTNYPEAFTPNMGENPAMAKALCAECPIRSACAEYGIKYERTGIYGGLTGKERRNIRQQLKLEPLPAE